MRKPLGQLENEGLVENVPRFGIRIPEDTCQDFARLHSSFHLLIAETSESPLLIQTLKRVINPNSMANHA